MHNERHQHKHSMSDRQMLARMSRGSGAVVNYRIEGSWRNAAMQFRSLDNLNGPVVFGGLVAQRSTPVFDAGGSSCFSV